MQLRLVFTLLPHLVFAYNWCPPLGPALPASQNLRNHAEIQSAVSQLTTWFSKQATAFNDSAISLALASVYEEEPILNMHWTGSGLNHSGSQHVDEHTVYRLGSISKLYTVLQVLLLEDQVKWTDSVTKYLPELKEIVPPQPENQNPITTTPWDAITIGALASQLSGIARECESSSPWQNV